MAVVAEPVGGVSGTEPHDDGHSEMAPNRATQAPPRVVRWCHAPVAPCANVFNAAHPPYGSSITPGSAMWHYPSMADDITRRHFMNGIAIAIVAIDQAHRAVAELVPKREVNDAHVSKVI
jgi:hypothetical protein